MVDPLHRLSMAPAGAGPWYGRPPRYFPVILTGTVPFPDLFARPAAELLVIEGVLERAQAGPPGRDEHRHVPRLVLVLPHLGVRLGDVGPVEDLAHAGIDAALDDQLVGLARLQEVGEVAALDALLAHPHEAGIHRQIVAGGAGAEHHHAAALHDEARHGEGLLAGMLEHEVDVVALAGVLPDRRAELAALLHVFGIALLVVDVGQRAPAVEVVAVDDALGAEAHDEIRLRRVGDHADRIGAGGGDQLDRHRA